MDFYSCIPCSLSGGQVLRYVYATVLLMKLWYERKPPSNVPEFSHRSACWVVVLEFFSKLIVTSAHESYTAYPYERLCDPFSTPINVNFRIYFTHMAHVRSSYRICIFQHEWRWTFPKRKKKQEKNGLAISQNSTDDKKWRLGGAQTRGAGTLPLLMSSLLRLPFAEKVERDALF